MKPVKSGIKYDCKIRVMSEIQNNWNNILRSPLIKLGNDQKGDLLFTNSFNGVLRMDRLPIGNPNQILSINQNGELYWTNDINSGSSILINELSADFQLSTPKAISIYKIDRLSLCNLTISQNVIIDRIIRIIGINVGGYKINQLVGQQIRFQELTTTIGENGYVLFNEPFSCVELICHTPNYFQIISTMNNPFIN